MQNDEECKTYCVTGPLRQIIKQNRLTKLEQENVNMCESCPTEQIKWHFPRGAGGGGLLRILSFRDDRMEGQKSKPKKSLDQNLTPKKSHDEKISRGTTRPGYAGTVKNLPIVLNTPKNLLTKKILAKIFLPKKTRNRKFQTHKNLSIIPVT